jgi:hypothetical protein
MDKEYGTLLRMGTWEMEKLPEGRKPVGCYWVYAKKK